jgi:hypothetical protein
LTCENVHGNGIVRTTLSPFSSIVVIRQCPIAGFDGGF